MPSCSTYTSRAFMCGCSAASVSGSTGAQQASLSPKTSAHSAWVFCLNVSVKISRSSPSRLKS